jgi:hypothetical protein
MDASSEPLCFGMNLEKIRSLDQKYFEKQKGKLKLLERIYSYHSQGRRATQIIGEGN